MSHVRSTAAHQEVEFNNVDAGSDPLSGGSGSLETSQGSIEVEPTDMSIGVHNPHSERSDLSSDSENHVVARKATAATMAGKDGTLSKRVTHSKNNPGWFTRNIVAPLSHWWSSWTLGSLWGSLCGTASNAENIALKIDTPYEDELTELPQPSSKPVQITQEHKKVLTTRCKQSCKQIKRFTYIGNFKFLSLDNQELAWIRKSLTRILNEQMRLTAQLGYEPTSVLTQDHIDDTVQVLLHDFYEIRNVVYGRRLPKRLRTQLNELAEQIADPNTLKDKKEELSVKKNELIEQAVRKEFPVLRSRAVEACEEYLDVLIRSEGPDLPSRETYASALVKAHVAIKRYADAKGIFLIKTREADTYVKECESLVRESRPGFFKSQTDADFSLEKILDDIVSEADEELVCHIRGIHEGRQFENFTGDISAAYTRLATTLFVFLYGFLPTKEEEYKAGMNLINARVAYGYVPSTPGAEDVESRPGNASSSSLPSGGILNTSVHGDGVYLVRESAKQRATDMVTEYLENKKFDEEDARRKSEEEAKRKSGIEMIPIRESKQMNGAEQFNSTSKTTKSR